MADSSLSPKQDMNTQLNAFSPFDVPSGLTQCFPFTSYVPAEQVLDEVVCFLLRGHEITWIIL